jgi:hypothetical protein
MDLTERRRLIDLAAAGGTLAADLQIDPVALDTWLRTGRGLKRHIVRFIVFAADQEERRLALEQSGLPTCAWAEGFVMPEGGSIDESIQARKQLDAHVEACSTCLQRVRFVEQRFPAPKPLLGPVMGAIAALTLRIPRFLRPAAAGAALLCIIVGGRALLTLPALLSSGAWKELVTMAPLALLAAAGAGASGGLMYSATQPLALRLGAAADYVSGIAAVAGYFAGMIVLGPYAFGEPVFPVDDRFDVWVLVGLSIVFGLALGHGLRGGFGTAAHRPNSA